jgi:hypothetical protein
MREQPFALEIGHLWKRCWLPAIVALAVMLGLALFFMSVVCSYRNPHSAYVSNASIISRQVEFK